MIEFLLADPVGLVVQVFFAVTLVFMIRDGQKPPLITSVPTGIALMVLGFSFTAPVVGIASFINGCIWLVLAYQRYAQKQ